MKACFRFGVSGFRGSRFMALAAGVYGSGVWPRKAPWHCRPRFDADGAWNLLRHRSTSIFNNNNISHRDENNSNTNHGKSP